MQCLSRCSYNLRMEYAEAKALGLKKYNTGRPCINGHTCDRNTSTRTCTRCMYLARKKWALQNPEKNREHSRMWKRKNGHGYNQKALDRMRAYYRKRAGLPEPTRPVPENCECCASKLLPGIYTHLDHCHATGVFRGWLCNRCNRGLGYFGDTIEGLQMALRYLQTRSSQELQLDYAVTE